MNNNLMETKAEIIELLDGAVKNLAQQRAMIIKLDIMTEEEITDFINEAGAKYGAKYDAMNPVELFIDALDELVEGKLGREK